MASHNRSVGSRSHGKSQFYSIGKDFCDMASDIGAAFRALHEADGAFLIPNPWDAGSAVMVGGDDAAFKRARLVLECIAKSIAHVGAIGV